MSVHHITDAVSCDPLASLLSRIDPARPRHCARSPPGRLKHVLLTYTNSSNTKDCQP